MKRTRGRNPRRQNTANRSYDSNGPEVRVRGTAMQIYDKYQALARDAQSAGDRVKAENLLQHAEHYYRLVTANQATRPDAENQTNDAPENNEGNAPQAQPNEATGKNKRADNKKPSSKDKAEADAGDGAGDGAMPPPLYLPNTNGATNGVTGFADSGEETTDLESDAPVRKGPLGKRPQNDAPSDDTAEDS